MPELAEVEFYRKQWDPGLRQAILSVHGNFRSRIFRGIFADTLRRALTGAVFTGSQAHGKQMLFRFSGGKWLGLHLGMSGTLRSEPPAAKPRKHDHLVLHQKKQNLVLNDYRHFGRVRWHQGPQPPPWWTALPPSLLSGPFTPEVLAQFLKRRSRSPLKAVLLMQERFPGIGNWIADEILWRARLHPRRPAGSLETSERNALYRALRTVCRQALKVIGTDFSDPPPSWLFSHRWKKGGSCPRCSAGLRHDAITGRTSCWCPRCQPMKPFFGAPTTSAASSRKTVPFQTGLKKRWARLSKARTPFLQKKP